MPTRKQRRRQEKARRHEWEYVYVDDEGREVEVEPDDVKPAKQDSAKAKNAERASRNGKVPDKARRPRRTPQPPSWTRAAKRAALLGSLFVVVFAFGLGGKGSSITGAIAIGVIYSVAFIPLQYFIDRVTYRAYLRRQGEAQAPKTR